MKRVFFGFLAIGISSASAGITYLSASRSISGEVLTGSAVLVDGEFIDTYESYSYTANSFGEFSATDSVTGLFPFSAASSQTSSLLSSGGSYQGGVTASDSFAQSIFNINFTVSSDSILDLAGSATANNLGEAFLSLREADGTLIWAFERTEGPTQAFSTSQNLLAGETYSLSASYSDPGFDQNSSTLNFTYSIPEPTTALLTLIACGFLGIRRR